MEISSFEGASCYHVMRLIDKFSPVPSLTITTAHLPSCAGIEHHIRAQDSCLPSCFPLRVFLLSLHLGQCYGLMLYIKYYPAASLSSPFSLILFLPLFRVGDYSRCGSSVPRSTSCLMGLKAEVSATGFRGGPQRGCSRRVRNRSSSASSAQISHTDRVR